ncbi:hypothetical protein [Acidovorax sp.]|uniref:hypothetical protein n=1 Tax=Acidovorax sp. TaxID=1872122 RepID=UPI003A0FD020
MLDVETSGLDMRRDRLLAIAAIALRVDWQRRTLGVALGDSFEVVLQQDEASSKDNILLHGIGAQMQRNGHGPPPWRCSAFEELCRQQPALLAFHAAFDRGHDRPPCTPEPGPCPAQPLGGRGPPVRRHPRAGARPRAGRLDGALRHPLRGAAPGGRRHPGGMRPAAAHLAPRGCAVQQLGRCAAPGRPAPVAAAPPGHSGA